MILSFHDWIAEDLALGFQLYENQEVGLGDFFLESILSDTRSLLRTAGVHRSVFGYHRKLGTSFPFGIYYLVNGAEIMVYAILDQRRRPSWIREELVGRD